MKHNDTMNQPAPILLDAKQLAQALNVSKRAIGLWLEQGSLPHYRFGKSCLRFDLKQVLQANAAAKKENGQDQRTGRADLR